MCRFLLISLFIFPVLVCVSQSPVYKYISVDDGLPSNEVYHIMQDTKGYIWFGTDNGVSRYDGYTFTNYDITDGLTDNEITFIYEDYKARIWFLSLSSRLSYFENDSIYHFLYNDTIAKYQDGLSRIFKLSLMVDSNDVVYLGTTSLGLVSIQPDGSYADTKDEFSAQLHVFDNKVLFGRVLQSLYNTITIHKDGEKIIFETEIEKFIPKRGWEYSVKAGNKIIFGSNALIFQIEGKQIKYTETENYIVWLSIDHADNLWIGYSNGGADCYKNADLNSVPIHYLGNKTVTSVLIDNECGTWLSTLNGIYYYKNPKVKTISKLDGLVSDKVNKITKGANGKIWFITSNEYIYSYNRKLKEFRIPGTKYLQSIEYNHYNNSIAIGAVFAEPEQDSEILRIDSCVVHNQFFELWQGVKDFYFSNNNERLVVHENIVKFKGRKRIFGEYDPGRKLKCLKILYKSNNLIWLACQDGLWKYMNGNFEYYGKKNKLLANKIEGLVINNETLYMATNGVGLIIFKEDSVIQFSKNDGLPGNTLSSLFVQNENLWVGTNDGLCKITLKDGLPVDYMNISEKHGLASNMVNDIIVVNDTVFVATDKGLSFFNCNTHLLNSVSPPVYISKVSIMEKDTLIKEYYELSYHQNSINIDFLGLNYKNAGNVKYMYKLSGIDNNWVSTTINKVRYPALEPGKYTFEVYAINEDGVKSNQPASVKFVINKPYWNTWWFYSLMGFAFLMIIMTIYFSRLRNIKKREQLKQELNKYRQQALGKQMNPHFIFNSLNSIQHFILKNDRKGSNKYLAKFSDLMRQTLENSSHDSIPIESEINALNLYLELETLRFKDKFNYEITIDPEIDQENNKIPTLLIQPYVENAIWHGIMPLETSGFVKIELTKKTDHILCTIEDNGIGRKRSAEINANRQRAHKSMGTSITESRLHLINNLYNFTSEVKFIDLTDRNEKSSGTMVKISLPII